MSTEVAVQLDVLFGRLAEQIDRVLQALNRAHVTATRTAGIAQSIKFDLASEQDRLTREHIEHGEGLVPFVQRRLLGSSRLRYHTLLQDLAVSRSCAAG